MAIRTKDNITLIRGDVDVWVLGAKVIGASSQKDVDFTIRGRIKIVLIIGQLDLAMFVAKASFAPVCRVSSVATLRRAAQCALVCEAVTIAPIGAEVSLALQSRPRLAAEMRPNGNFAIRCGEADLAAAAGGVNVIMQCGVARGAVVCEIGHPCVTS